MGSIKWNQSEVWLEFSRVIILLAKADDNYELFSKFRLFSGQSWCKLKLFKRMLLVKPKRADFMLLDIFLYYNY